MARFDLSRFGLPELGRTGLSSPGLGVAIHLQREEEEKRSPTTTTTKTTTTKYLCFAVQSQSSTARGTVAFLRQFFLLCVTDASRPKNLSCGSRWRAGPAFHYTHPETKLGRYEFLFQNFCYLTPQNELKVFLVE